MACGSVSAAERRRLQIVEARDAGELFGSIAQRLGVSTVYAIHVYRAELKRRDQLNVDTTADDDATFATPRTPSGVVDRNDRT